jgi:hypothetical protein
MMPIPLLGVVEQDMRLAERIDVSFMRKAVDAEAAREALSLQPAIPAVDFA